MLRYQFQKDMMKPYLFESQEREQLVHDVADEVLSHISATVDVSEVFDAINGLNDKIDSLERK